MGPLGTKTLLKVTEFALQSPMRNISFTQLWCDSECIHLLRLLSYSPNNLLL